MHLVNDLTNYIIGDGSWIEQPKHTAPGRVSQTMAKNTGLMKQQIMTEGSVFDKIDSRSLISPQRTKKNFDGSACTWLQRTANGKAITFSNNAQQHDQSLFRHSLAQ